MTAAVIAPGSNPRIRSFHLIDTWRKATLRRGRLKTSPYDIMAEGSNPGLDTDDWKHAWLCASVSARRPQKQGARNTKQNKISEQLLEKTTKEKMQGCSKTW